MRNSKVHLLELTSIRFIAALGVVVMHFVEYLALPQPWAQVVGAGGIGVTFFFVLSGFVLTYNYREFFQSGVKFYEFRDFFLARLFRIYPAYFLALMLMTMQFALVEHYYPGKIGWPENVMQSWLINFFAMQTFSGSLATQQFWNAPSWSISTEFCFYLSFPFIIFYVSRYFATRALLTITILHCLVLASLLQTLVLLGSFAGWFDRALWLDYLANRNVIWRIWEFAVGVVTAYLLFDGHLNFLTKKLWRNIVLSLSVGFVFALTLAPWPSTEMSGIISRQFRLGAFNILPFAAIIAALAAGNTLLSPIFRTRQFILLGEASFALYIYHWLPITLFAYLKAAGYKLGIFEAFMAIITTVGFSVLSFKWYETPIRKFFRKFAGISATRVLP